MNSVNVTIRVDKDAKKQEMKYTTHSEPMKAAEEAYDEHPNLYKELAK